MALNNNFHDPQLMEGGKLKVTGAASGLDDHTLLRRYFALRQPGGALVKGEATLDLEWKGDPELQPAGDIVAGPALAIGVELYFGSKPQPSFSASTWSQDVTILKAAVA